MYSVFYFDVLTYWKHKKLFKKKMIWYYNNIVVLNMLAYKVYILN